MPDKKLTDSEIVKALECCIGDTDGKDCFGCPLYEIDDCQAHLNLATLDLINRQKEEKGALINGQETLQKYITTLQAEIKDLQKVVVEDFASEYDNKIKAEAYKEFADEIDYEILHKEFWNAHPHTSQVWLNGYEQCMRDMRVMLKDKLKEMEGDNQ